MLDQLDLFDTQPVTLDRALHFLRQRGPGPRHWIMTPCWVRMVSVWLPATFDRFYSEESAIIDLRNTAGGRIQRFECSIERIRFTQPDPRLIEETQAEVPG